ncbi:winged helix DNA-binding domain-containing protein [Cellulomonas sp. WB94]|uniref:winged helix DNA-binding domain-containing protein n=1 Tax=Cellulomonas sp. WB94 TaxID=2173174 RepID=UPI000D56D222|nr:winged helix DNA-binding domain-containing protein [Cellulomonas sp. WB94]PVU82088.1 winged helix DNA-binding domain-containing protein [Cellulomonas sp. WB94]
MPTVDAPLLTRAALNRALLARQHLLARATGPALDLVDHLVGLQAQNPPSPYTALWSRLEGFRHADIGAALESRRAARIAVMRGTIHLVTAADALVLPGLASPLYARDLRFNTQHGAGLRQLELAELTNAARALVEESPRTTTELGRLLAERWPRVAPTTLAYGARGTLPLVQVPPRGVWRQSGATTWTTADAWFGPAAVESAPDLTDPDARAAELERLVLRFLAAFGPASVADVQQWSGLGGLRSVVDQLRDRLVTFRAEPGPGSATGRELFDLPDAPRPDPAVDAPIRFLPDLDNLLLAHADRTRVISEEHRRRLTSLNGGLPGSFLADGRVAGTWTVTRERVDTGQVRPRRELATLELRPFDALDATTSRAVTAEGEGLVRFVADDAADHRVRVVPP